MGQVNVTVLNPQKYDGRQYLSREKFTPWPQSRKVAPGQLVTFFPAIPPGYSLPKKPDTLFWWTDAQFLHNQDNRLVVMVTAYESRGAGWTPLVVTSRVNGLVYTMNFNDKISCEVLKGTRCSTYPHINPHPDGCSILFNRYVNMTLLNLNTLNSKVRHKDFPSCNFRYIAQAPNGKGMAYINRVSKRYFEIRMVRFEFNIFTESGRADLHHLHKGFEGVGNYTDEVEAKFSPDSQYIAVTSSFGKLLVMKWEHSKLILFSDPVPCLLQRQGIEGARLSNARCADFDPRVKHSTLAIGCEGPVVYICDIVQDTIDSTINILEDDNDFNHVSIDCLRYSPRGRELVIASSDAQIRLYHPDLLELLYTLDGSNCGLGISMVTGNSGYYPNFIRMSFAQMGDMVAVTATDGFVRLWQLQPDISLQHLTRMKILENTATRDLLQLPLPEKLILYLLQWPTL